MVVLGWLLDLMILEVFSNLNDSTILWFLKALYKLSKIICWLTNGESIRPVLYCADTMEELIKKVIPVSKLKED